VLLLIMGRPLIRLMMTFASLIRRLYARVGPQWFPFSANSFRMRVLGVVDGRGRDGRMVRCMTNASSGPCRKPAYLGFFALPLQQLIATSSKGDGLVVGHRATDTTD